MKGFLINRVMDFLTRYPALHRVLRYRNPREYWRRRGGEKYYREQEGVEERHARSHYIAQRLKLLAARRILEIGCGYGKQLKNLSAAKGAMVVGVDWSLEQLQKAREFCQGFSPVLIGADAAHLPFRDKTFDLILTSAVIMHNPEPQAKAIVHEILRVGTRYVAHNEDSNITFTRHGYDMRKTYEKMGIKILDSGPIPLQPPIPNTQFTVVELSPRDARLLSAQEIPLQYHAGAK